MYDVNKYIANLRLHTVDPHGYLADLDHWSPRVALRVAEDEGLMMEDEHWQVVFCLREMFRERGPEWTAREMTRQLEHDYAEAGGRRYLYGLFPRGPLAQACPIAGLPLPHGTLNSAFGSVH